MDEKFRQQVNTARRAGYTDDQIFEYIKDKDPRINDALSSGYEPSEIVQFLAPPPTTGEEVVRKAGIAGRGMSEAMAPMAAGALAGGGLGLMTGVAAPVAAPVGALAGALAVPAADVLVSGYNRLMDSNVQLPSQAISNMLPGPRAETPAERVIQSSGGALTGTGGTVQAGRSIAGLAQIPVPAGQAPTVAPGLAAIGREVSRAPISQIVTAPVATAVGQGVTEVTGSPLLGLAASLGTSAVGGMQKTKREQSLSADDLLARSKANYDILDNSGFQLDTNQFKQHMATLPAKLRTEIGYVDSVNPRVAGAFKELISDAPKDVAEITALRRIIGSAAKSNEPTERMAAMRLLDEFDDYVMNAPPSAIVSGNKTAMDAWKAARADYSKVKKAEIIEDIVLRADVSQTGKEATIAQGLSALAKNPKRMRFFSPDEQKAIREAAKGGTLQSMLRTVAKFTPMTPAAAIFTAVSPFGAYTAGAGMAAKELATRRRLQQVDRLTNQMRLGGQPKILETAFANQPIFATQAMRNMLGPVQQENLNNLRGQ